MKTTGMICELKCFLIATPHRQCVLRRMSKLVRRLSSIPCSWKIEQKYNMADVFDASVFINISHLQVIQVPKCFWKETRQNRHACALLVLREVCLRTLSQEYRFGFLVTLFTKRWNTAVIAPIKYFPDLNPSVWDQPSVKVCQLFLGIPDVMFPALTWNQACWLARPGGWGCNNGEAVYNTRTIPNFSAKLSAVLETTWNFVAVYHTWMDLNELYNVEIGCLQLFHSGTSQLWELVGKSLMWLPCMRLTCKWPFWIVFAPF